MPARREAASRQGRVRQELLRSLLEEQEQVEEAAEGFSEAELALLLRQLRRRRGRASALGGLLPADQLQSFVWGVGVATLLLLLLPSAKKSLRPFAVMAVKGALDLTEKFKTMLAEAGEGLSDLMAEAQFERTTEGAGASPDSPK